MLYKIHFNFIIAPTQEKIDLSGIVTPTAVPFQERNHSLVFDIESQEKHLSLLSKTIIFLGSNAGESRKMNLFLLKQSIYHGLNVLSNTFPESGRVVGVLRKDPKEAIELAKFAQNYGAQAIVFSPLYTGTDIYQIRNDLLKNTSLPLIIYNNPDFQEKQNLPYDFITESARINRIIGIKDTSRSPEYFKQLLQLKTDNFHILQGDTKAGLNETIKNCNGMVAIEANIYPEALIARWQKDSIQPLAEVLNDFTENKKEFGGSLGYCKEILRRRGIFQTSLLYS